MIVRPLPLRHLIAIAAALALLIGHAPAARADWTGAATGTTNDVTHSYTTTSNWNGGAGPINDSFATSTFAGATQLYLSAAQTTAGDLNLGYSGGFNLTITGGG